MKSKNRLEMGEEAWKEYQRERVNRKSNSANWVVNWRRRTKIRLIEYKGGKCEICGYDKKILGAFDFHHRDPEQKDFSISSKTFSFDRLLKEVEKCSLVCRNCHAEIHDKTHEGKGEKSFEKRRQGLLRIENNKGLKRKRCKHCQGEFIAGDIEQSFCSEKCGGLHRRKIERPSKEELEKLLTEMSMVKIGKKFGVSDNSIRKWCRSYGIDL